MAQWVGVHLRVDLTDRLPLVAVDRLRIQHVLFVLVKNAIEAAAAGTEPRWIEISTRGDRYALETSIKDSGEGVPVGQREQLFRPFFTTKEQGTGLGLASSRAIIESHDGAIGSEELTSAGCRFWFRLPLAEKVGDHVDTP